MVLYGHDKFAQQIRDDAIDILFDMQVYTRGTRMQVLTRRPAPIIVSCLVFPATSGMAFVDYLVVDSAVVPAEHAEHYTEKLWLLPTSYQVDVLAPSR
jgi:predicted O-linked N-acetylglucosamine transferase (SPINDLY family)